MPSFLFSYRVPGKPLQDALAELDDEARAERIAAWRAWFDSMGASLIQRGDPVLDARTVGNCGLDTMVGGYSLVSAEDLDAAVALAETCPGIDSGGGVDVGIIAEVSVSEPIEGTVDGVTAQ
jgi:hypothetical protein